MTFSSEFWSLGVVDNLLKIKKGKTLVRIPPAITKLCNPCAPRHKLTAGSSEKEICAPEVWDNGKVQSA